MASNVSFLLSLVTRCVKAWYRWVYVNLIRVGFGQAKVAKLTDIDILYKSENFIVVNKREDVKINSDLPSDYVTVATQLKHLCPETVDNTVSHGFRFIHRLDYATSGVICIALTKKAAQWGHKAFEQRKVTKHYFALVRGHMDPVVNAHREIDIGIGIDSSVTDVRKMCVETDASCQAARSAHTTLHLLEHGFYDGEPASKVLLIPSTGRTHQLRVHCLHIGHQIIGDYAYSNRQDVKPYRMMLHAYQLQIPMPREHIDVTAAHPFTPEIDPLWSSIRTHLTYEDYTSRKKEGSADLYTLPSISI